VARKSPGIDSHRIINMSFSAETLSREETIVVPDVEKFPGHIACSSESRSEIVVPVWKDGKIIAILNIDSENIGTFDDINRQYLEKIVSFLDI